MKDKAIEKGKIIVRLDADLKELIPRYLENRRKDIKNILSALDTGDYQTIEVLGHSMKGTGGGYGLDFVSKVGHDIELSAKDKSCDSVRNAVARLADFLDRLEIAYE